MGVLVAAGLAAAVIAYPVFEVTSRVAPWPFHRVYGRIAMLAAAGALVYWCRRFGVANRRDLGYGLPWRRFWALAAAFGGIGIVTAGVAMMTGRQSIAKWAFAGALVAGLAFPIVKTMWTNIGLTPPDVSTYTP